MSNTSHIEIYQCDEHNGVPNQVMPLLTGEPLSKRLKREPLPPLEFILNIARQTVLGLDAAHAAGLMHRDVKPENLFLGDEPGERGCVSTPSYRIRILDFGLAGCARTRRCAIYNVRVAKCGKKRISLAKRAGHQQ